jgi:hypothetical protein
MYVASMAPAASWNHGAVDICIRRLRLFTADPGLLSARLAEALAADETAHDKLWPQMKLRLSTILITASRFIAGSEQWRALSNVRAYAEAY